MALAAIKEQKTLAELSKEFEVSPNQISLWKQEALKNMDKLFSGKTSTTKCEKGDPQGEEIRKLRENVGELTIERDLTFVPNWLRSA